MGEEVKARTDPEWEMQVRQVEALEKIADALEALASVVEPETKSWSDPEGWAPSVCARGAYLRTE